MNIGFDLDGTLDRPALRDLALSLIRAGHGVYIVTGVFAEAMEWQDAAAKRAKLERLGIPFTEASEFSTETPITGKSAQLVVLQAVASTFSRDYRLADLGLRKGAYCERQGITLFFEDSETYAEMIPKMSGNTTVLLIS